MSIEDKVLITIIINIKKLIINMEYVSNDYINNMKFYDYYKIMFIYAFCNWS